MNAYLKLFMEGAVLIAFIIFIFWIILKKTRNDRILNIRDASLSSEELEDYAEKTAIRHMVSKRSNILKWPASRMNDNYDYILSVYKALNEEIQKKNTVPPAAEWLLDNFYVIEEQFKGLKRDLTKKAYLRLPVLRSGPLKGYARIFAITIELVAHTNGQVDEEMLSSYLKAYQTHRVLFDREIWAVPVAIRLALLESIRFLCEDVKNTQIQWHHADETFNHWLVNEGAEPGRGMKLVMDHMKTMDEDSPSFVEHLFYRLRRSGRSYTDVLRAMDENLAKFGTTTELLTQKEHRSQSVDTVSMGNYITSLRYFSILDWADLFESVSFVEQILNQDPDGTYPRMDLQTRDYYKHRIETLAAIHGVSELHIAREAITLATQACSGWDNTMAEDAEIRRTGHVGYYLVGKGIKKLESRQEKRNRFLPKKGRLGNRYPGPLYLGSIGLITLFLVAIAVQYSILTTGSHMILWSILAGICVLIPASEIAVNAVNWAVCKALKPAAFPRLELKEGIPEQMSTIVAVPTLLPDVSRVKELVGNLESHYLANREKNLYFVLIGAFRDSDDSLVKNEGRIIETALREIKALNEKYCGEGRDIFYFFHRASQYNETNNKWIGWERKRGALMEFNDLVLGATDTSFSYFSSNSPPFTHIKYIITLDSDTVLPMGMARKMIGTMAHPLNRPVINQQRCVVTEGYGLMQPRIDVDSDSSNKSLFSRIFTGQEGIDPYANAISDVYQDLFGEGIFTGKGIYDLKVFQDVLKNAIPENAILSHDLLEGSYVRTGLVTDLKLVDSYPSKYNSYASRLHRWVRGDWQLFPLLFGKIASSSQGKILNPLSLLSRWKMVDNLRRSLVPPALMVLAVLSFSVLPGSVYFWLAIFLATLASPLIIAAIEYVVSGALWNEWTKRHILVMDGLKASFLQNMLDLIFIPYQAWLMASAIGVTLYRVIVTKKNLLEWVTSADVEKFQKNSLKSYTIKMNTSFLGAVLVLTLALILKPASIVVGLFLFLLWGSAPFIAWWISRDLQEKQPRISMEDRHELGKIARKTWRFFEEFANTRNHYLVPDNYQVDPPRGIAHRTSPTNIGLGLLATLAARDLGYIGSSMLLDKVERTVTTIEQLEKWNGHLYNWYDTQTLSLLQPGYVSTVDSGNLLGYLITLREGLTDYLHRPLVDPGFISGIRDTLYCAGLEGQAVFTAIAPKLIRTVAEPVNLVDWNQTLNELIDSSTFVSIKNEVWQAKSESMIRLFKDEMDKFMPAITCQSRMPQDLLRQDLPENIVAITTGLLNELKKNSNLLDLPALNRNSANLVSQLVEMIRPGAQEGMRDALAWLSELSATLLQAIESTEQLADRFKMLIKRVDAVSEGMAFLPLYVKKKQLFSIGYSMSDNKLTNSYYDLLASESRQASYICIARGEIPPSHWFKLGRALTVVDRYKGLVSWTGTMFEYLMPLLIMKRYKNTLLDETYSFVIKSQKKYGRLRGIPWGISESGFNSLDAHHDYQYKAIGIPWLGLKRGLIEDAVAAPYATCLALLVDPEGAVQNMRHLKADGLEGPYGYYEAADYTPERLPFETKRAIVKCYMAHHQGMSLLAIDNFINKNPMQERFHADPAIHAARLLLQEKVPANLLFTKEKKERVIPFTDGIDKETSAVRRFSLPDPVLPKAHILSNGNYSIMITDRGTGYSKGRMVAVTRWRSDLSLDTYGMFFYLRNVDTQDVWSATYAPLNVAPDQYEVEFASDKATFKRSDGVIDTKTEVVVASGDNVEIRRISIKNNGDHACILEITSYFEVVLTTQAADMAHPAFSNLFVETGWLPEKKCIIANRRPRSETEKRFWIANAAVIEGKLHGDVQYETDRMQLIGRGHRVGNPVVMEQGKPLSNTAGPVLDPVMSIRVSVKIEPGKTARVSFVTAIDESKELLLSSIERYESPEMVGAAFRLALARSRVETNYLNLGATEMTLFQGMLSHILFISPLRKGDQDSILKNKKGQSSLWRYGISGDLPIVLVILRKSVQMQILNVVLKAHEYWRLMDLNVDLVILSEEEYSYALPLYGMISDIVLSSQTHDILHKPGDVFILDKNKLLPEDVSLLYAAARIRLFGDGRTMAEQVNIQSSPPLPEQVIAKSDLPVPAPSQITSRVYENIGPVHESDLLFDNGMGGFRSDGHEYVIRLEKDQYTPAPWINVIANPGFGFTVSEAGSGYTWYGNSRENKLTPWNNDAVSDTPGEMLYISEAGADRPWSVTPLPIREDEPYTIRHGFGYSVFEHTSHGIEQSLTQFVPVHSSVKVSILSLTNASVKVRHLSLTYYIQPILGVSDQVTAMHLRTRTDGSGALLFENPYNEVYPGQIGYIDSSVSTRSVTGDRKTFFGSGDIIAPECLAGESLSGVVGAGYDTCAAIQVKVSLEPGESRDVVFLLGMAEQMLEVNEITQQYREIADAKRSLIDVKTFWKTKIDVIQVNTPSDSMNLLLNGWLQYQVISCRMWAKSGFYQSGGAFGFRDQLQDCLAIAPIWPEIARAQILLHARHQFTQGDVQHWWHEPEGKGIRTRFSDDLLWLPFVTTEYIRITGDGQIMAEEIAFLEDEVLSDFEEERYGKPGAAAVKASLYEHCVRAVDKALKFGSHDLPLMGSGDWNDGMNTVGNKGSGESVWLGWFLISILEKLSPFCVQMSDSSRADRYHYAGTKIAAAIEANAWDGNWYRRAYFDNGLPLGSVNNTECKIDSIAQTWAVLSGAGDLQRSAQAMKSLEDYLILKEDGLIKLLAPPFDTSDQEPGYIKGYLPGIRENGGQYTHAAIWVIMAFARLGNGDKAHEMFELINPINHARNFREYSRYKLEPYVMAADVYSTYPHTGRGGWSWYTGSAGWMYQAGLTAILGFEKIGDQLIMNPCIPAKWTEYKIDYQYFATVYHIKVLNPEGVMSGVKEIFINGTKTSSSRIDLVNDGKTYEIMILMGAMDSGNGDDLI